jgi:hypothetical protein
MVQKHFGWPKPFFIPADPVEIVFWDYTGDRELRSLDIDPQICSMFSIPADCEFSFLDFIEEKKDLGQMVDTLIRLIQR